MRAAASPLVIPRHLPPPLFTAAILVLRETPTD